MLKTKATNYYVNPSLLTIDGIQKNRKCSISK